MKENINTILCFMIVLSMLSCTSNINEDIPSRERSLLEFRLQGQIGTVEIERDGNDAKATVYILASDDYPYSAVTVEGLVMSRYATTSVQSGETLNFSNPERKAKITVTSESGENLDWWVYLKPYDAFYVGTWKIDNVKIHCDQRVTNSGNGVWDTQLSGGEFGNSMEEYDNRITISLDENIQPGNELTGTITNDAGNDALWSNFRIVIGYYSPENYLDMNPRLRYQLPPGTSTWKMNLATNIMYITQNNVSSTMIFGTSAWGGQLFRFMLPDASNEPWTNNEFSNMWRSSTELFYEVTKISN